MYLMLVLFIITVTCLTMHSFIVQLIFTQVSSFLILILVVLLLFWNQAGKEQLLNEQKQALPSILNDKLSTITLSEIVKDWSNVKCREIQNTAMKLTSLFPIYLSVQNLRDLKPYRFLQELFHQSGSYFTRMEVWSKTFPWHCIFLASNLGFGWKTHKHRVAQNYEKVEEYISLSH